MKDQLKDSIFEGVNWVNKRYMMEHKRVKEDIVLKVMSEMLGKEVTRETAKEYAKDFEFIKVVGQTNELFRYKDMTLGAFVYSLNGIKFDPQINTVSKLILLNTKPLGYE